VTVVRPGSWHGCHRARESGPRGFVRGAAGAALAAAVAFGYCVLGCHQPDDPGARGAPALLWFVPVDSGTSLVAPGVSNGTAYFMTWDHHLHAVDERAGVVRWSSDTYSRGFGIGGRNIVFAGTDIVVPDYDVSAFNPTGALAWGYAFVGNNGVQDEIAGAGDSVFVPTFNAHLIGIVRDQAILGGPAMWDTPLGDSSTSAFGAVYDAGAVYVGLKRFGSNPPTGSFAAVDARTGQVRWTYSFGASPKRSTGCFGRAVISGDVVIVADEEGTIVALDRAAGTPRWSLPRLDTTALDQFAREDRPLTLAGGVLVAGSGTGVVLGVDPATGRELWRTTGGFRPDYPPGAPTNAVAWSKAALLLYGGALVAYRPTDGQLLWIIRGSANPAAAFNLGGASVSGDTLFVSGFNGFAAYKLP
jgi:outer membrane protein assembly factor BamB